MYSMPNGVQDPGAEEEGSGGESGEEHSEAEEDEESDESTDEEEVDSPPRREMRSKHTHDPARAPDLVAALIGQSLKRPRTSSPMPTEKPPKQSKVAPLPAPKVPKPSLPNRPKLCPGSK